MLTACLARLLSLNAGIRLQLLLSTEFTDDECLTWSSKLLTNIAGENIFKVAEPILNRAKDEPSFAVNELKTNILVSSIVAFTSGVEYFLEDLVILCLRKNSSLRKKAFSTLEIKALEMESVNSLEELQLKHISLAANQITSGSLFSAKFKKTCGFLDIKELLDNKNLIASLDSIWMLRNEFAHINHASIKEFRYIFAGKTITIARDFNKEQFQDFVIGLCDFFYEATNFLHKVDNKSSEKWNTDKFLMII